MRILVYWHDMLLPHSAYLVKAFDHSPHVEEAILLGPRSSTTDLIFNQQRANGQTTTLKKTKLLRVKTYPGRPLWCKLSEYIKYISTYRPDMVVVIDEALSMNVLLAGLATKATSASAKVIFYGFDNIYTTAPFNFLRAQPTVGRLLTFLKKTARFWLLDKALMPWRRRLVYGGLTSYQECTAFIHRYYWYPVIKEQWWPINTDTFLHPPVSSEIKQHIPVTSDQHTLAFVGRFVKEKGIYDLINAVEQLPDIYQLLLIGAGEEQQSLQNTIKEKKLGSRVHLVSPLNQDELATYFQYIDLLVLPSCTDYFWKEQYGRVLVEAMTTETLTLGSDSGSIPYVINDTRFIFKEGDISDLVEKVIHIFEKKLHRHQPTLTAFRSRALMAEPQAFIEACCTL